MQCAMAEVNEDVTRLGLRGLEMGIDFKGGMEFVVESRQVLEATAVRAALANALGQEPEVKTYSDVGEGGDALRKTPKSRPGPMLAGPREGPRATGKPRFLQWFFSGEK